MATRVHVQWKGTDVCLDFSCSCGDRGHFDGMFAYRLRCGGCGKVWQMPVDYIEVPQAPDDGVLPTQDVWDLDDEQGH